MRTFPLVLVIAVGGCHQPGQEAVDLSSQTFPFAATVVSYELHAEWDHFEDGTVATYDTLTIRLEAPPEHHNELLAISVAPQALPDKSPFRVPGTCLTFSLDTPISAGTRLAWDALRDLKVTKRGGEMRDAATQ